ncbi:MAG: M16 family metallopeptidase [Alphaproteobacteria bacterium]
MTDRDIRTTTLPSGLRVVSDPMQGVASVALGVWIGAGARCERVEENGVSHLIEHMLFKGTKRRTARQIAEVIEDVGGQINAYTSREVTAYYVRVLRDDTALGVDVLADLLQDAAFDERELKLERDVILQEIGQARDTPDDLIFDLFQAVAYPDQPLGRPVLGRPEVVEGASRAALIGYRDAQYRAGNMVVAAAGAIEHDRLVDLAARAFDRLPAGVRAPFVPAVYSGGEMREERDLEQVHLVLGFRGVGLADPDYYALSILSGLFGGGMSSRLFQEIREKRGLVYAIDSMVSAYADDGVFAVYAGTGEDQVGELVPMLCDEIVGLAGSIREDEVARARAQLRASLLMGLESPGARCEQIAQHTLSYGRVKSVDELLAAVAAVDGEAIARLARKLFATAPTLAALGPLGRLEPLPAIARRLAA